jgi:uncharacterized protein (TIGR02217 family)
VVTGAGHEQRNVDWAEARGRWDVASGLKNQAQLDELIAFLRARKGRALELTRFRGHPKASEEGVHDAENTSTLLSRVPPSDGGAGPRWPEP